MFQRELEQYAKNCRVLQFKLRKAERQREQTTVENEALQTRLEKLANSGGGGDDAISISAADMAEVESDDAQSEAAISATSGGGGGARNRELESELRIAKALSVRLHQELESAEEKR